MAERDQHFMNLALGLAREAAARGEVPVGAILVENEQVIASSGNSKENTFDPLGHAEIRVIQEAAKTLGRWRLSGCTLYVTLEPCTMCAGALVHARVDRVVYGAKDPKAGGVESLYQILSDSRLNHQPKVQAGILAQECGNLLTSFFAARREANKKPPQKS